MELSISITEASQRLPNLINQVKEGPITITSDDKPVGVLLAPEEYIRLRQAQAYLRMLHIAHSIEEGDSDQPDLAINTL